MSDDNSELCWTVKLDWLNILIKLNLDGISQIPEYKKEKALKKITKSYGPEILMEFEPEYLEELVAIELGEIMKKELSALARQKEKMEEEIRNKVIPFKKGGIVRIDPNDLKNLKGNPEDMLKYFYKDFYSLHVNLY